MSLRLSDSVGPVGPDSGGPVGPDPAWRIGPLAALMLLGAAVGLATARSAAPVDAQSPSGSEVFAASCASCHQAGGEGVDGTFPPLAGNPSAADADYVEGVVREGLSGSIEVLGTTYDGVMPPVAGLSDPEIAAVVAHVVELAGPAEAAGDEPAAGEDGDTAGGGDTSGEALGVAPGDAGRGRGLFIGSRRFDGGAPACGSCHVAGSVGDLGGAALGPDLTSSFETLGGEAGLTGWLANPPSATMAPVFADRPLTESELADVVAFLGDAPDQERPDRGFERLIVAAVVGLAVLVGGMALAWRGARRPYVAQLRSRR